MEPRTQSAELIPHFEGLVRKSAARIEPYVEEEFDDICQFLRMKVWYALERFDPSNVRSTSKFSPAQQRDRFVFACMKNAMKDVLKKKQHNLLFIEDIAPSAHGAPNMPGKSGHSAGRRDAFEQRYLSVEENYDLDPDELPLLPSTLSDLERRVVLLLYFDFEPAEIARQMGISRRGVKETIETIKVKMADWSPVPEDAGVAIAA